ncbi:hypothetical protein CXF86_05080, partial [Shewanella sp. GutCb]|uniref:hypothetical protein n=1 Tax=Shewanella sp. GutCb TaxID=2058315 RepID=UPI000CAA828B
RLNGIKTVGHRFAIIANHFYPLNGALAIWRLKLRIEQSRGQYIFNRIYTESISIVIIIFTISVIGLFSQDEPNFDFVYFAIGVPVVFALWLSIFNSGESKIVENGITIDKESFIYIRFNEKDIIKWSQYDGYKITGGWLRDVIIKRKGGSDIVFSYYTFSSEQRTKIFKRLDQQHC